MSHFVFSIRAHLLKRKLQRYEHEKHNSIRIHEGISPNYTIFDKYHHFWVRFWRRISELFACCTLSPDNCVRQFFTRLCSENTFENYIIKSVFGFLGGVVLTYLIFTFLVIQYHYSVTAATALCTIFALLLTLGLAFSLRVRCFVFLLLPQLFSSRGRQALMAYTLILAISGPGRNTINNMNILSESMTCTVEELKHALMQILDAIKRPFIMIRDALHKAMAFIKKIAEKLKEAFMAIKRIIIGIGALIKNMYHWLKSVVNICNTEVGTPFQRCVRVFGDAVVDCQAKLGPMFDWLCSIAYVADALCITVYFLDLLCLVLDFIRTNVGVIGDKLKEFANQVKTMFYVKINISRDFEMETTQSKTYKQIAAEIAADIQERVTVFMIIFSFIGMLFSTMFINILFRIWCYKRKFLTAEHFDNVYITQDFIELDVRRAAKDMETVLPLTRVERTQYIVMRSFRLIRTEKQKLARQFLILSVGSFKILTYLFIDYGLFWLMMIIKKHGRFKSTVNAPNMVGVHIEGDGVLANLMRSIVNALRPFGIKLEIDTIHCLPDPLQPDMFTYAEIGILLGLCWLLALLEPYGLRLRAHIMGRYHPDRAKQRAVWLYNHILKSRVGLLKFLRRQLRRRVTKGGGGIEKVTLLEQLEAWCPVLRTLLGVKKDPACLLCAHVIREGRGERAVRCYKPGCPGTYCEPCFAELGGMCTLCMEPVEYGDLSDVSLEEESDDDEDEQPFSRWRQAVTEETMELLPPEGNGHSSHADLPLDYQEDMASDPNVGKSPLVPVESHVNCPRPVLSSTQLFSEPRPADYSLRRSEILERLDDTEARNMRQPDAIDTEELKPKSTKWYPISLIDCLCWPCKWFRNRKKKEAECEPLLQYFHPSTGEDFVELQPHSSSMYSFTDRDRTLPPMLAVSRASVASHCSRPSECSSVEEIYSQLVYQLEEEHGTLSSTTCTCDLSQESILPSHPTPIHRASSDLALLATPCTCGLQQESVLPTHPAPSHLAPSARSTICTCDLSQESVLLTHPTPIHPASSDPALLSAACTCDPRPDSILPSRPAPSHPAPVQHVGPLAESHVEEVHVPLLTGRVLPHQQAILKHLTTMSDMGNLLLQQTIDLRDEDDLSTDYDYAELLAFKEQTIQCELARYAQTAIYTDVDTLEKACKETHTIITVGLFKKLISLFRRLVDAESHSIEEQRMLIAFPESFNDLKEHFHQMMLDADVATNIPSPSLLRDFILQFKEMVKEFDVGTRSPTPGSLRELIMRLQKMLAGYDPSHELIPSISIHQLMSRFNRTIGQEDAISLNEQARRFEDQLKIAVAFFDTNNSEYGVQREIRIKDWILRFERPEDDADPGPSRTSRTRAQTSLQVPRRQMFFRYGKCLLPLVAENQDESEEDEDKTE
ncbi:DC-STAMP domain-containing protein 2-like isoform X2 [Bacillus rossius redtenbacheri]|uniref:DC-STAMP domain-containing protein 2-like isoform X2 n=1 Tax=Bacillus rossius redtenbacheri TaxID=93214 RepID=UPI002FDE7432